MSKETEHEDDMSTNTAQIKMSLVCYVRGLTAPDKLAGSMQSIEVRAVAQLRDHVSSLVRGFAEGVMGESSTELNFSDDLLLLQLTNDLEDVTGVPAVDIRAWLATVDVDAESDETTESATESTAVPFGYPCGLFAGDRLSFRPHVRAYLPDRTATVVAGVCSTNCVQCEDADGALHIMPLSLVAEATRGKNLLQRVGTGNNISFCEQEDN